MHALQHNPPRLQQILVVEDEKVNAMVIIAMLQKLKCKVTLATHGQAAINWTTKKHFDCILMDIEMPEMDGVETTVRIRQDTSNLCKLTPIIAFTAHTIEKRKEQFFKAGMNAYLKKPIEIEELSRVLKKHEPQQEFHCNKA